MTDDRSSHAAASASEPPTPAQLAEFFRQIESGRITKESFQMFLRGRPQSGSEAVPLSPEVTQIPGLTAEETTYFTKAWEEKYQGLGRTIAEYLGTMQTAKHFPIARESEEVKPVLAKAIFWREVTPEFILLEKGRCYSDGHLKDRISIPGRPLSMILRECFPQGVLNDISKHQTMRRSIVYSELRRVYALSEKEGFFPQHFPLSFASLMYENLNGLIACILTGIVEKGTSKEFLPLLKTWQDGYWPVSITDDGHAYFLATT